MTDRRTRFLRLTSLREKQHDETVAGLRAARGLLESKLREMEAHQQDLRHSFVQQDAALREADHHEWMLSCVSSELASLHAVHSRSQCAVLEANVAAAEAEEVSARRELRQTERLLESIRNEEMTDAARKEQKRLDEAAQVLRRRSSNHASGLATFT